MIDHCTGWPEGSWGELCCKPHDEAFAKGGSLVDFLLANVELGRCVASIGDLSSVLNAPAMAIGTTIFGLPFFIRAILRRRAKSRR